MLLTTEARRRIGRMLRAVAGTADRLERRFRLVLHKHGYDEERIRAFLAMTPAAASRLRGLPRFLEQAGYSAHRLAKLNVPPEEVHECLAAFDALLAGFLGERFSPAREQLLLATTLAVKDAFYCVREAEAQAFFGLSQAEVESRDLEDLLQRFGRVLGRVFRARAARIVILDDLRHPALAGPVYIERGQAAEGMIAGEDLRGRYASYWSFPLSATAVAQFGFPVRYPWLPREYSLLEAAAKLCRFAEERAQLQGEVARLHAEARRSEDEERRRIGRELHDEAGQSLLLLRLELERLEQEAAPALRSRLGEARLETERIITELRRIVAALSPAILERLGLESALRRLAGRFRPAGTVRVRISLPPEPLGVETQQVIYRVAQESLQNIAKHSQADRVNLSLYSTDKELRLRVTDNGTGFSAEAAGSKPMSFGLAGMQERASLLGGTLLVRSSPGKGTKITLRLPKPARVEAHGKNANFTYRRSYALPAGNPEPAFRGS